MVSQELACPRCGQLVPTGIDPDLAGVCLACGCSLPGTQDLTDTGSWFYMKNGQRVGPVVLSELARMLATGQLRPNDIIAPNHSLSAKSAERPSLPPTRTTESAYDETLDRFEEQESVAEQPTCAGISVAKNAKREAAAARAEVEAETTGRKVPKIPGYEILDLLGRGGMGVVYKARQKGLNRIVALKMLLLGAHASAADLSRFRAEAEAVARLKHKNIVSVYNVGQNEGLPYFSLEYVEGGSLAQRLRQQPIAPLDAARMLEKLARAAHTAHTAGIVHRDLKPANVLLTNEGEPKIADFGVAKYIDDDSHTATGAVLGTPSYTAPEQASGNQLKVGPPTDVYSLGAILYEMLTDRPPFFGRTLMATLNMVRSTMQAPPIPAYRRVPKDLATICMKCLEKDISRRYPTAMALAEELHRFLRGEPIEARPPGLARRAWFWCKRNPFPISLMFAVIIAAGFGFWHLASLSDSLVRSTAIDGARHQAEMLDAVGNYYSAVIVDRVKKAEESGIEVRHDYKNHESAIPIPATMTIELGQAISDASKLGVQVRVYSDHPFKSRTDGGPRDAFEATALAKLRENPGEPYYEFQEYQGRPVLRYAASRIMKESCVKCHNSHPESTKTDWKVGDVRGAFEIIRPLDQDQKRGRDGIRTSLALITGISVGLLTFSIGLFFMTERSDEPEEDAGEEERVE